MKKMFLSFLSITLFGIYVSAQTHIGYRAGFNLSNVNNTSVGKYSTLPAFNTGAFGNFYFSDKYYLDVELLYSVKGFRSLLIPAGTTRNQLNYLSLPVLMSYKINKKFELSDGPEFNYLINASMINSNDKSNMTANYKKFDLGIDVGAGYYLSPKLKLQVRYFAGLSKVVKYFGAGNGTNGEYSTSGYNSSLQMDIAYIL